MSSINLVQPGSACLLVRDTDDRTQSSSDSSLSAKIGRMVTHLFSPTTSGTANPSNNAHATRFARLSTVESDGAEKMAEKVAEYEQLTTYLDRAIATGNVEQALLKSVGKVTAQGIGGLTQKDGKQLKKYLRSLAACGQGAEAATQVKDMLDVLIFQKEKLVIRNSAKICPLIVKLKHLHTLDLTDNHRKKLSKKIWKLTHLHSLILTNNEIKELPGEIKTLRHLENLDVSICNQLTKLPREVGELPELYCLDVSDCPRLESIGTGAFSDLETINLEDSPRVRIPASLRARER
ncbi:MAG: hypothetical protein OXF02_07205 [Simkaniaceae bacterium]|nr:hypothetical protein [Simkaniaceae bacterium]